MCQSCFYQTSPFQETHQSDLYDNQKIQTHQDVFKRQSSEIHHTEI